MASPTPVKVVGSLEVYGGIAVVVVFLAVVWLVFRTLRFVREVVGAGLALILMAGAVLFVLVDMGMI